MNEALLKALEDPELTKILLKAAIHADTRIRKYIWRGFRPKYSNLTATMPTDKTAEDFVSEAILRLLNGIRTYDATRSLLDNLNSITDSLISSEKKASDRTGLVNYHEETNESGAPNDPISLAPDINEPSDNELIDNEIKLTQQKCFENIYNSLDGDKQAKEYLDAIKEGFIKPSEISELTGMPIKDIYEISRKVKKHSKLLFGVQNYAELERTIKEG